MPTIAFFVPGIPRPGGSKRAFAHPVTGKIIVKDDNPHVKDWRAAVATAAFEAYQGSLLRGPIRLTLLFVLPRPKYHYGTGRNLGRLKPNAPSWHTKKPDRTKLLRSTEDALKGVLWSDDAQIVDGMTRKIYGDRPGGYVIVEERSEPSPPLDVLPPLEGLAGA